MSKKRYILFKYKLKELPILVWERVEEDILEKLWANWHEFDSIQIGGCGLLSGEYMVYDNRRKDAILIFKVRSSQ